VSHDIEDTCPAWLRRRTAGWPGRSPDVERLVITAVTVEKQPVSEVARSYGVARSWICTLLARYRAEGEAAFEPRSRRPLTSPRAISADTADLIVRLRKELTDQGLDAGPVTIAWHLEHHHNSRVSAATVGRHLTRHGLVTPEPRKRGQVRCSARLSFWRSARLSFWPRRWRARSTARGGTRCAGPTGP